MRVDLKAIVFSAVFAACDDGRPPLAATNQDAAALEDASIDAASFVSTADAGVDRACPPVVSTNGESVNCMRIGDGSYACTDGTGAVYGSLWRCPDFIGTPSRPPLSTCVATARDAVAFTTDYVCDPLECTYVTDATCGASIAVTCPVSDGGAPGCLKRSSDAGTGDVYCCPK